MMFADGVVGQANAFAGGWGNLGAGAASICVAALIGGFQQLGLSDDTSWRLGVVVPGILLLVFPVFMYALADDCPQGAWRDRLYNNNKEVGDKPKKVAVGDEDSAAQGSDGSHAQGAHEHDRKETSPWIDWRVWLLFVQYACCFGVELAINNSMTSYLFRNFVHDTGNCSSPESFSSDTAFFNACSVLGKNGAAVVAGLFGLMNLFARALGGLASDRANKWMAMRGRLGTQFLSLLLQGVALTIFSRITSLPVAIFMLVVFSVFVQASEGSTFAVVPFMSGNIGVVAGIVGAGGNVGAVCWSSMIRAIPSTADAYLYLGVIVIISSLLTLVLPVHDQLLLFPSTSRVCQEDGTGSNGVRNGNGNGHGAVNGNSNGKPFVPRDQDEIVEVKEEIEATDATAVVIN